MSREKDPIDARAPMSDSSDPIFEKSGEEATGEDEILSGWNAIATVLGVTARTAQRRHQQTPLPIFREKGKVKALRRDLEQLMEGPPPPAEQPVKWFDSPAVLRPLLAIAAALLLLNGVWQFARSTFFVDRTPVTYSWVGNHFAVANSLGKELWQHAFQQPRTVRTREDSELGPFVRFLDIDGDGSLETLVGHEDGGHGEALFCFSPDGKLLWKLDGSIAYWQPAQTYSPAFRVRHVVTAMTEPEGTPILASGFEHVSGAVSRVIFVRPNGVKVGEYWQRNSLDDLVAGDLDGDRTSKIFVAGSNDAGRPTIAVIDPNQIPRLVPGQSPEGAVRFERHSSGGEAAIITLPKSGFAKNVGFQPRILHLVIGSGGLRVVVSEGTMTPENEVCQPVAHLIYQFDRQLKLMNLTPSRDFRSLFQSTLQNEPGSIDREVERMRDEVTVDWLGEETSSLAGR